MSSHHAIMDGGRVGVDQVEGLLDFAVVFVRIAFHLQWPVNVELLRGSHSI